MQYACICRMQSLLGVIGIMYQGIHCIRDKCGEVQPKQKTVGGSLFVRFKVRLALTVNEIQTCFYKNTIPTFLCCLKKFQLSY